MRCGRGRPRRWLHLVGVVAVLVIVTGHLVLGLGVAALAGALAWLMWGRWRARSELRRQQATGEACRDLAAELAVGRVPHRALQVVAARHPAMRRAALVARLGGDPAAEWLESDDAGLVTLGRAWRMSVRTGAGLADAVAQVHRMLATQAELRDRVDAELASARASTVVLLVLPGTGLAMAALMGADPGSFLLGSGLGKVVLGMALALCAAGLWWSERIAAVPEGT